MEITKELLEETYPKVVAAAYEKKGEDGLESYRDMRILEKSAMGLFGEEYAYELFKLGLRESKLIK